MRGESKFHNIEGRTWQGNGGIDMLGGSKMLATAEKPKY